MCRLQSITRGKTEHIAQVDKISECRVTGKPRGESNKRKGRKKETIKEKIMEKTAITKFALSTSALRCSSTSIDAESSSYRSICGHFKSV